jgi:hypothetical protein
MQEKLAPSSRHSVVVGDRVVYQWSQTLTDVDIFVPLPPIPNLRAKMLYVNMKRGSLEFGLINTDPYMKGEFFSEIIVSESTWMLEDGELHITLSKACQGENWTAAMKGHDISPAAAEDDRKRLLLERFQREHPGMDFSGAAVQGEAPDPSTFMGGFAKQ